MKNKEQAKYIDLFLREIHNSSTPTTIAWAINKQQLPNDEDSEKFKTLEHLLEELEVVTLINGRDNSTLNGQCEYLISQRGRELVEKNKSALKLLNSNSKKNTDSNWMKIGVIATVISVVISLIMFLI